MAQHDESQGFLPGPLDELVPGLRKKSERWPALPVHPRILEGQRDDGSHDIVFASFAPAASLRAYHAALKPLVEAALLSELSRPRSELQEQSSPLRGLELYAFAEQPFDARPALDTFAFAPAPLNDVQARRTLAQLRRECQLVDGLSHDEPLARYAAHASVKAHPLREPLAQALLASTLGPFGAEPGSLARAAAGWLNKNGFAGVEPTRGGIERFEELLTQDSPYVLRWMDPILFQALCDLIAMAAHVTWGRHVEWGVSDTDPETRVAPPPLLRVHRDEEAFHVPVGEHVLRWCVMPARVGEDIPSLGAWAEHEFT